MRFDDVAEAMDRPVFLSLEPDDLHDRLWANWYVEGKEHELATKGHRLRVSGAAWRGARSPHRRAAP